MIDYIKGIIEEKGRNFVTIETSGIGFKIFLSLKSLNDLPSNGSQIKIYTYLHIKDDGFQIYGFLLKEEKSLFEKLISVNGVGPKAAMSILSTLSIKELYEALETNNYKSIEKSPGIGRKTAQRIILELKEKLLDTYEPLSLNVKQNDVLNALISLGYTRKESISAIDGINCADIESAVKQALKRLMK